LTIDNTYFNPGTNERFLDLQGTISQGNIRNNFVNPASRFYAATSYKQDEIFLSIGNNTGVADSTVKAQGYLPLNVLETDIPAQMACVMVNGGTTFTFDSEERLTGATDGGLKYIGLEDTAIIIDGNLNIKPKTATKDLESSVIVIEADLFEVTFTNGTNIINRVSHGLSNNDTLSFKDTAGTLPAELRKDILYHVVNAATDTFQVSYTNGGAVIAFSDDGTPTNSYYIASISGGTARASISATKSIDVIPQGLINLKTNYQIYLVVRNAIDAVNIIVEYGYLRARK